LQLIFLSDRKLHFQYQATIRSESSRLSDQKAVKSAKGVPVDKVVFVKTASGEVPGEPRGLAFITVR
jgi:hypothetical protein